MFYRSANVTKSAQRFGLVERQWLKEEGNSLPPERHELCERLKVWGTLL